jgi:16S rRNA (cytosine967-C5)-methyltransferase
MPVSPARLVAFHVLCRLDEKQNYAVDLLHRPEISRLKEVDRRLATDLVMGVLRWRGDLDFTIEKLSGKPLRYFDREVLEALRLGVYQIRFLSSIPRSAAVNESVELIKAARKRSAAGLVNAVLRRCEKASFSASDSPNAANEGYLESACRSIPAWLRERWEKNFGGEAARSLIAASQAIPPTHLRITGPCFDRQQMQDELLADHVQTNPGRFGKRTLWVESGSITNTPAWREGRVVIQDEASQLVVELLAPRTGDRALDLCAAPGIKTWQIADVMGQGFLVACDRSLRRMRALRKTLSRRWPEGVRIHRVALDATRSLPFTTTFDRILVDVPCSGTGTLARNPEIKWRLQPEDIPRLAAAQRAILRQGLAALALGGRLVYSTCSLEPQENEEVVSDVLAKVQGFRVLNAAELRQEFPNLAPFFKEPGYFHTWPGDHRMDGFFAAVIVGWK